MWIIIKIFSTRLWGRPRIRRKQQLLRPTRWRRRTWPSLEKDARKRFGWRFFKKQVTIFIWFSKMNGLFICVSKGNPFLLLIGHRIINYLFLRDLGPAHQHPSSHCGLHSRRHLLLQHGRLILFRLLMYIRPYMLNYKINSTNRGTFSNSVRKIILMVSMVLGV